MSNVEIVCKCCMAKKHPNKGKFTQRELENAETIKAEFESVEGSVEHMWVKVHFVEDGFVYGALDNEPVLLDMEYGEKVAVPFSDIEDMI